jgi:hypothetical protein
MSASSGLAIALAVSSDKPWRVKSLALAAHIAEMLPSELISRISEAPPIEGAFNTVNQSRCFVAAPFN